MIRQIKYMEGKSQLADGIRQLCRVLSSQGGILVNGSYSLSALMIAKRLEGSNLYLNQGIRLAAEAIGEINGMTGCGTKEAAEFMGFLLSAYERKEASGISPVVLARELKKEALSMTEFVKECSVPIQSINLEAIEKITEKRETAAMVLTGMEAGELVVKESFHGETKLDIIHGMRLDGPMEVGGRNTLKDVLFLAINGSVSDFMEIYPLLEKLGEQKLFILANDFEGEALTLLNTNVKKNRLHVWGMKTPGFGRRKMDILEDAAVLTGTRVFDGQFPLSFKDIPLSMLGRPKTIAMTGQYTVISQEKDNPEIRNRIDSIKEKISDPQTNYYDQQKLRERIAGLTGAAPVIRAGGYTKIQVEEEKQKIEYAIAYAQTVKKWGMFEMEKLEKKNAESDADRILQSGLCKIMKEPKVSSWLVILLLQKVVGLITMWLTTGAVMVSTGYDREDMELMKSGVDIERLRG